MNGEQSIYGEQDSCPSGAAAEGFTPDSGFFTLLLTASTFCR